VWPTGAAMAAGQQIYNNEFDMATTFHIRTVHNWMSVCWQLRFDWSFACFIAAVVTIISIILSFNKIQNGDILVPANPGPPGKWPLKWGENCA